MKLISRELPIKSNSYRRQVRPGCSSRSVRVHYFNTVIGCSSFFFSLCCLKKKPNKADLHFSPDRQSAVLATWALCRIV